MIFVHDWLISQEISVLHACIDKSADSRNRDFKIAASKWISAESQHVHDEWMNDDHHTVSQVTMTVWHVKNHFVILAVTDKTTADSVSELHAIIYKAADSTNVWKRKWMKWSHVNWHQEIMKDWLTDISAHEKDSTAA